MTRNPFALGLTLVGAMSVIVWFGFYLGLSEGVLDYEPYDEGAALGMVILVIGAAVMAAAGFVGAAVLGGWRWLHRAGDDASTSRQRNPFTIGLSIAAGSALLATIAVAVTVTVTVEPGLGAVLDLTRTGPVETDQPLAPAAVSDYTLLASAACCGIVAMMGVVVLSGVAWAHRRGVSDRTRRLPETASAL